MSGEDRDEAPRSPALLERLADRDRWPRRWWWPHTEPLTAHENLERHHRETSETIRRTMLTLIAFSFFCAMSLAQSDATLFGEKSIPLPVGSAEVDVTAFLIVAPLTLLGLLIYLHVFIGHARRIESIPEAERLPTLFNMEGRLPAGVSYFVFYWLSPLVLLGFSWKAALRPHGPALLLTAALVTAGLLLVQLRRGVGGLGRARPVLAGLLVACVLSAADAATWFVAPEASRVTRALREMRHWNLSGANLRDVSLRGANLYGADLARADLRGADLSGATLRFARLTSTDLRGAILQRADLRGARFENAQLDCAFLAEANLRDARFVNSSLAYTVGLAPAMIDQRYRRFVPDLVSGTEKLPAACDEFPNVIELVRGRVRALGAEGH